MTKPALKGQALHDVHKIVFLAREYHTPEKTLKQIGELFSMTTLDINVAMWRAADLGYLVIDQATGTYTVDTVPEAWEFGDNVARLYDTIKYLFERLNRDEGDMTEDELSMWATGEVSQDLAVALKSLMNDRILGMYDVTTETGVSKNKHARKEETYTFYTLFENLEMRWGTKQFPDKSKLK